VSEIFREIEEELRRDRLWNLWSRYGRYLIAFVVVALLLAAAFAGWRAYQASERRDQAARYAEALTLSREPGREPEAATVFGVIAREGGPYSLPAAFEQAELLAKSGDRQGAIAVYDRLAGAPGIDREYRDLAVVLSVMYGLQDADPQAAIDRLAPLTASDRPWRATALELTAAAKLKTGDRAAALAIYQQLADDLGAPRGLRARAAEMAAALKS
jgi:hypothetical protein